MEKSCETRTGCTAAHVAAAAHSLGLSVGEKAHVGGLGHWETVVDTQTRTEHSTSAQGRDLFTNTDMGESCKKPGQLLGSVFSRNEHSSLSESSEQVRTVSSRALGQQLKASVDITKTKSKKRKKRKFTPKEVSITEWVSILFHFIRFHSFISGDSRDDAHDPGLCHPPGNVPIPACSPSRHLCGGQGRPLHSPTECH